MAVTLTPEVGSGLDDANSYIDVAYADQYHENLGHGVWAGLISDEKKIGLIRATAYVDVRFGPVFLGRRLTKQQALEWPRISAHDDDGFALTGVDAIPRALQKAVAEYGLRAHIYKTLAPDPIRAAPEQDLSSTGPRPESSPRSQIRRQKSVVGPLTQETQYFDADSAFSGGRSPQSAMVRDTYIPEYPAADLWIEQLIKPAGAVKLNRA